VIIHPGHPAKSILVCWIRLVVVLSLVLQTILIIPPHSASAAPLYQENATTSAVPPTPGPGDH
jgi:hypothetical protein